MLVVGTRVASMRVVYAMAVLPLSKSRAGEVLHVALQRRSFFIRWWYRVDTGGTTADEEQVLFAGAIVGKKKLQLWSPCGREKLPYHMPTRFPYDTSAACRARYLWLQRRSYLSVAKRYYKFFIVHKSFRGWGAADNV